MINCSALLVGMVAVLKIMRIMKYSDGLTLKLTLNVLLNIMYSLVRSCSLHGFMTSLQIALLQLYMFNLQSCDFSTNRMPVSYSSRSQLRVWVNKIEHQAIIWNTTIQCSIPMKPYIKGKYWVITTRPPVDSYPAGVVII